MQLTFIAIDLDSFKNIAQQFIFGKRIKKNGHLLARLIQLKKLNKGVMIELEFYKQLLTEIKERIRKGQLMANIAANAEMLAVYWDIGKMIYQRQQNEGWGKGVIPRLSIDLKNELPGQKGFSERNIARMVTFYKEYSHFIFLPPEVANFDNTLNNEPENSPVSILPPAVAELQANDYKRNRLLIVPWTHHIILIEKVKNIDKRFWYMQQIIQNGWSKEALMDSIKSSLFERQGNAVTNFDFTLPPPHSALAKQFLKDPYIFDFTSLATEYTERELEKELIKNVEKFLLELGAGFAFVGRQYHLQVSNRDFNLDLLFYHLKMRCFVVIDLKRGEFLPEYAGKMNFYCSAVDDQLKHQTDQPTLGLILCQQKDRLFAEYSLKDINKPIGISEYELTRILPNNLKSSLPSVEEIEAELGEKLKINPTEP